MSRYIDADKLMIKLSNVYVDLNKNMSSGEALAYLGAFILDAPTADVQEVRHGHWVREVTEIEDTYYFKAFCSVCNRRAVVKYKFCPHCGAKMDEEEEQR